MKSTIQRTPDLCAGILPVVTLRIRSTSFLLGNISGAMHKYESIDDYSFIYPRIIIREALMVFDGFDEDDQSVVSIANLEELAQLSGYTLADLKEKLAELKKLESGIQINAETYLNLTDPFAIDLRSETTQRKYPVPMATPLPLGELSEYFEALKARESVVCLCDHGPRSYSAAMYLRWEGVLHATYLGGGAESLLT